MQNCRPGRRHRRYRRQRCIEHKLHPDSHFYMDSLHAAQGRSPYLHDGRLPTLADTVEFFNLVLGTKLTQAEKDALVAYMLTL